MYIEYVTHASLLLKSNSCSMLLDPFYFIDPESEGIICHFPPREICIDTFGNLDYVFSSHIHPDHCHRDTLKFLKEKIQTVLLPAERPELAKKYLNLGFSNIIFLENRQTLSLQEGVEVTCYWDDPIDSILIVKMDDKIIFHQNDCRLTVDTLKDISAKYSIDYAFLVYTEAQDLYPLLLPRSEKELNDLVCQREQNFLDKQINLLEILQPKIVIPYAYTITYFGSDQITLNDYSRLTPSLFCKSLANHHPQIQYFTMQPGDVINSDLDSVAHYRKENLWGTTVNEYIQNIIQFRRTNQENLPKFNNGKPESLDEQLRSYLQMRISSSCIDIFKQRSFGLRIYGNNKTFSYLFDFKNRHLATWTNIDDSPDKLGDIEISMPASILGELLNKKHDPLSIIYTYKIKFKSNISLKMSLRSEVSLYIFTIIFIFNYELIDSGNYVSPYSVLGQ